MSSKLEVREIHDTWFHLSSSHTCYANERNSDAILSKKDALDLYRTLGASIKTIGGKVSHKNKTKADITEISDEAHVQFDLYAKRFEELKEHWVKVIPDMHVEDQSTEEFSKGYEMRNTLRAMMNRNTELSRYIEICTRLQRIKDRVESSTCLTGTTIYL